MLRAVGGLCTGSESVAHLPAGQGVLWGGGRRVPVAASLHFHAVLFPFVLYVFFIVYKGGNWVSSYSNWVFWVLPWSSEKQLSKLCPFVPFL